MVFLCLLVPILLLVVLLALGRFEDFVLRAGAPTARGAPSAPPPPTGWPALPALPGAVVAAAVPTGTE